jgi:hypothetical protein
MPEETVIGTKTEPTTEDSKKLGEWTHQVQAELIDEDMHGKAKLSDYVRDMRNRREELKERMKTAVWKPGDGAKPEEIAAWNKALGVPDKPDDYEFGDVKILDEQGAKAFKALALKEGLSVQQAKSIVGFEAERTRMAEAAREAESAKAKETTLSFLKATYPNDWEAKLKQATSTATQFFGGPAMEIIERSGLGNQEWFVRGMVEVSKHFTEGGVPRGAEANPITGDGISLDDRYPSMAKFKA